jgi:hypothetical protein
MNLPTKHKVHILRYPPRLLNYWNFNVRHPVWVKLFFLTIFSVESELGTTEDLSLELNFTILENMFECVVKVLETRVENLSLESWFQLLEEYTLLNN